MTWQGRGLFFETALQSGRPGPGLVLGEEASGLAVGKGGSHLQSPVGGEGV